MTPKPGTARYQNQVEDIVNEAIKGGVDVEFVLLVFSQDPEISRHAVCDAARIINDYINKQQDETDDQTPAAKPKKTKGGAK